MFKNSLKIISHLIYIMEYIPHQLGLVKDQAKNLIMGKPVVIPFTNMGCGAGEHIMMLKPRNAKKLLSAYKKGKGVKINLMPDEIHHSIHHGQGFFDVAKKVYNKVSGAASKVLQNPVVNAMAQQGAQYGADAVGTAVGAYLGNPQAGHVVGNMVGQQAKRAIANKAVKADKNSHNPEKQAVEIAQKAVRHNIDKLPSEVQPIAKKVLKEVMPDVSSYQGLGILDEKFSINDVGRTGKQLFGKGIPDDRYFRVKGGSILDEKFSINDVGRTGKQLFGRGSILDEKFSINDVGRTGKQLFGGKLKKGSAEAKAFMASIRKKKKGSGMFDFLDPNKNGVAQAFAPDKVVGGLKTAGHYAIPAATSALGGIAGTALTGGPIGGIAGSAAGSYAGDQINKKIGIGMKRGRGRPRKVGGAVASASTAYRQALRRNFSGLELQAPVIDNPSVSNFKTNPRVRPSSTEMTLSPYAKMDSPAMNPFIPTRYTQMGGTSNGYGGRGLYGPSGGRGLY